MFQLQLKCSEKDLNVLSENLFEFVARRNFELDTLVGQEREICKVMTTRIISSFEAALDEPPASQPKPVEVPDSSMEKEPAPQVKDEAPKSVELEEGAAAAQSQYNAGCFPLSAEQQYYQYCMNWPSFQPFYRGSID